MTKLKNVFLLAAMAVSAGFVGCNKEDDEGNGGGAGNFEIKASEVFTGTVEVDSVKVVFWSNENQKEYVVASAPYKDGAFMLNLPATIADEYLNDWSKDADVADVKGEDIENIDAYKNGKKVGRFYYTNENEDKGCFWIYINKAAGSRFGGTATISCNKGWSIFYYYYYDEDRDLHETTTIEPSGLMWRFYPLNTNE